MTDTESMDDAELLRRFAAEHSEASFARLARRHTGLVFDIALRVTGSRPLAEEIVQNVFLGLARKASRVAKTRVVVAAWLHRAAVLESRAALRAELRHRKRLMEAAPMITEPSPPSDPRMTELLQSLDEALNSLPMAEREILLSHYYGRQSYQEAGLRLGTSEAGARQLAARARKRLAAWFGRRGKEVPAASIGTLLAGHFPAAAPSSSQAALEAAVTRAVLSPLGPPPSSVLTEFLKCLPLMKLPAALCLLAGFLITFLPGRGMPRRDTAAVPDAAQKTIQPLPSPAGRSRPGSGAAALTDGFDLSQFEKEMATVVRLSKERHLGFLTRFDDSFESTDPFDLSYGRQMQLARLVMNQPAAMMPALLEACQRADPGAKGSMVLEAVFARWAEGDPAAARAAIVRLDRKTQNHAVYGICGTLIRRDVAAAAREILSFPIEIKGQFSDGSRRNFIMGILSACVERNPQAALTSCLDAPERVAAQAMERGMGDWIRMDPAGASQWLGNILSTGPVPGNGGTERLCVDLLTRTRPDLAVKLVECLPAGELRDSLAAGLKAAPTGN